MTKNILLLNLLLFSCLLTLNAQTVADSNEAVKPEKVELRQQSFEKVWNIINEKHYDPTFGGIDWPKMRQIYQPQAEAAKSDAEFHGVLNRMLRELKLSHFAVYQPTAPAQTVKFVSGIVEIELKILDNQAVISQVKSGSTAEQAGLKTGFVIEKIDGKTVPELLAPLEKSFANRPLPEAQKKIHRERTLLSFFGGKVETKARIEVSNGKNQRQVFDVARVEHKGEMSQALGNFPPQEVVFKTKRLENGIGYIRFNMWIIPQMPKIREAIRLMKDADGIIFDVRGNPGGIAGMAPGVAGLLVKKQTSLGSMTGRDSEIKFIVYPQADVYEGKIVIIADYGTGSTSEIFAAGMQEIGRAKVVGERSAGAVLPSLFDTLPTGAIFQYAISDYKSPKSILIENRGVIPDTEIKLTRQTLLDGRDVQIEEAIKQIKNVK